MKKVEPESKSKEPGKKPAVNLLIVLVLVVAPLVLYWQTTGFDLVWDDGVHLILNPYLNPASSDNLLHFWKEPYKGLYIPVAYNAWGFLGSWFTSKPHDPFAYHLANVLLHTLNGLFVFALLRRFVRNPWAAMSGALVFLMHPVQVESVAWVSEFRGLLATLFGFAALYLHVKSLDAKYGDRGARWWPGACGAACFLLAVLSKPSVAVLPFFAAAMEYYLHRPSLKRLCSRSWLWFWLAFSVAIAVVTSSAQETPPPSPFWAKPFIWMDAAAFYLYKLFFPVSLAGSYARTPDHVMGQWWFYVTWMIPVGLGICLWRFRAKAPLLVLAAALFLLGFLPVSGLKEFGFQAWSTVADRYLYLSMLGVALGVGYAVSRMGRKWQWGLVAGVILILGGWSFSVQVPVWETRVKLWTHCIEITPEAARAYKNRGAAYLGTGEFDLAIPDFDKAISLDPDFAHAYYARGLTYVRMEETEKAISDFGKALSMDSGLVEAYRNRGLLYSDKGEYGKAIADFDKAVALNPEFPHTNYARGLTYLKMKKNDKAISDFDKALSMDSELVGAYSNRGLAYYRKREYDKAMSDFNRAIFLDPEYSEAYNNRGVSFAEMQRYDDAIVDFNKVVDLKSQNSEAYKNRATAYYFKKEFEQAISDFTKAIALDPGDREAYKNRGIVYNDIQKYDKALADWRKVQVLGGTVNSQFLQELIRKAGR